MHPVSRSQSIHSPSLCTPAEARPDSPLRRRARRRGRGLPAVALAAAAGLVWLHAAAPVGASPTAGGTAPRMSVGQEPSEPYEPMKRIRELLRLLYSLLGGDPENLGDSSSPETEMIALVNFYAANGVPANLTFVQRLQGRLWIEESYVLAVVVAPQVDPSVLSAYLATLGAMYEDLGG